MPIRKKRIVNVAVVGLGFMGGTHLRAYQKIPNARVVAVCGQSRLPQNGILRGISGNVGAGGNIHLDPRVKVHRDFDELLGDGDIELVDICTPTKFHAEQAIAALKAGKHVLCEKPLARTAADARRILKIAEASKTYLMPGMCMRFWPGWAWLKEVIDKKIYGEVLSASFRRLSEKPGWSRGDHFAADRGGVLFDLHIHDTDFVNYLFGPPDNVFSTGVMDKSGVIQHIVTQYQFTGGPAVCAEGSWLLSRGFNMSFTILCEGATLDYDMARGKNPLRVNESRKRNVSIKTGGASGWSNEIEYFVDCVARGKRPQTVTVRDAVTALEICEAEEKSLQTGKIIKI